MMDLSDATRRRIFADEEGLRKIDFVSNPPGKEEGHQEKEQEEEEEEEESGRKCWSSKNGDGFGGNCKRSLEEEESTMSKKRRKQLKPIKIASSGSLAEEMVKVPKQIIGLNNDFFLGNQLDEFSHPVPQEISSKSDKESPSSPVLTGLYFGDLSLGRGGTATVIEIPERERIEKPETIDSNVPINLESGPNQAANPHFLFPLSFRPPRNAGPAFWSEAHLKIFNQEAYCELCKKEFCNKYFLKTHKANKHGIYFEGSPGTAASSSSSGKLPSAHGKPEIKEVFRSVENGRVLDREEDCVGAAFCELCNKKFCNKYFARKHKSKSHGLITEEEATSAQGFPGHEAESKTVQIASNNSTKKVADSTLIARVPSAPPLLARENEDQDNQRGEEETGGEQDGPLNLIVNFRESDDEEREEGRAEDEEDCSTENIEKLQTMLLRLNPSEGESKSSSEILDSSGERKSILEKKEIEYLSEANDSSSESKLDFGGSRLLESQVDCLTAGRYDHLKQTKPTSSYCEICNKELCNKYFMRTHMQRMHGIEIEQGTQIGGVVCNICNKELCSKYFLRVHKQNTHGIMSPNSNSLIGPSTSGNASGQRSDQSKNLRGDHRFPSGFAQACYICNKRFRSAKWLQAHFVSDHHREEGSAQAEAREEDEEMEAREEESVLKVSKNDSNSPGDPDLPPESFDVISKIFWERDATSKMYNCSQCSFTTSVLAFLFVHERSHFVVAQDHPEEAKPSAALQNLIHDKTFWQHQITQQIPECLDLSSGKSKCFVGLERNGS